MTGTDWEKGLRCVACQICEKECPPKCIYIEKSKDKKPDYVGKPQIYPAKFDIDISVCMSCQICVEVCPFEAIKMDTEFELATDDRFGGLLLDRQAAGEDRTSTTTRFIPTEAAEVDARLAEEKAKAEAKAKAAADAAAAKAAAAPTNAAAGEPAPATCRDTCARSRLKESRKHDRQARPDFRSAEALDRWLSAGGLQTPVGVILSVVCDYLVCIRRCLRLTTVLERKGLGRMQNRLRPESRGSVRNSAADGGRHQVADQGRHCSD